MSEQLSLYFDTLEELSEKDQEYMSRKYRHVLEKLDDIDAVSYTHLTLPTNSLV